MGDELAMAASSGLHSPARSATIGAQQEQSAREPNAACGPIPLDQGASARTEVATESCRDPTDEPPAGWVIVSAHGRDLRNDWRILVGGVGWCRLEAVVVGGATRREAASRKRRLWVNLGGRLQHMAVAPSELLRVCCSVEEAPP